VKNISKSFTHKMAAKASWHWTYFTVALCISFCPSLWYICCIRITDGLAVIIIIIIIKGIYIAQVRQGHKCSCIVGRRSGPYVAARMFVIIGATTAEKLVWTSRGVDADFLPFPLSVPSPSPVIAPPLFHPFPFILFFPAHLKFSKEVWGAL